MGFPPVVVVDERQDCLVELLQAVEDPTLDDALLESAEPDFDLVEPGSVDGGVDEVEAASVSLVELGPPGIFAVVVDVQVVPDDVDLLVGSTCSPRTPWPDFGCRVRGDDRRPRYPCYLLSSAA